MHITKEKLDMLINGVAHGNVATRLQAMGMNINALRPYFGKDGRPYINVDGTPVLTTNATLRYDEWKHYDKAIVEAALNRLNGVGDLISRGLVYTIPNGLASTVMQYEDASQIGAAQLSMDGVTRGKNDRMEYDLKYLPLPICHKDFQVNSRVLAASRVSGSPLDTTMGEQASRRVAEQVETMLFQGTSAFSYGGGVIYGYVDAPYRVQGSLTHAWDSSAATGATILLDVLTMKQALINVKRYGPYVVYVPTEYEAILDEDFKANSDLTIRQRLLQIANVQDVKVADYLTAGHVVMVQMTSDTVRMVNALPLAPVEWESEGGMVHHFKVMTIQVPQIRADQNNSCGIADFTE